ncbi:putative membrane-associated kinase regulator [Helianthus annuus]|uniref:Membrane-associated kinase regulator 2/5 n=1 Tax=Helianthus annuus TaxID=4232 RepID=A0A251U9N5_HELAN|nr:probable membrane-associated kinase regulator 2 [Helianthus annuus]KAF5797611.1 putative membrane-associated kinase regulator 2/5 [Helianthus annuus]KAJ0549329.1 putative membrane-associated kinase regulator [Helianthus annuus]KAJ0562282.1 putative membrane-associated kinase regulator [Helianthus annuus]KAJ0727661.1 putative membrane-associated kinase regulator [Helianthus annuus]KAJ0730456.1 putative membrane-associated kinase regulator [Helianthus annuus]
MEAFSLLRYWRTTTNAAGSDTTTNAHVSTSTATTTTIVTTQSSETDDDNDHGPFFDLEFSLPAEEEEDDDDAVDVTQAAAENKVLKNAEAENSDEEEDVDGSDESGDEDEDESELKFTLIDSDSSGDVVNVSVSPSDELFFNGGFVPVEQQQTAEIRSKPLQSQSQSQPRVLLMKSATKFRVMMLKLKKIKSTETTDSNCSSSKEDAPIVSLFKRHNSSKAPKKRQNDVVEPVSVSSEEKKFSKEAMHKYLRKVKPLYVRVSNRYGEKLKFTGQLKKSKSEVTEPSPESSATEKESKSEPPAAVKQGNLPAGLRVVLRKSRSAFTAVAAAPAGAVLSNRRDDSLIQQQDGIQSAILHCKRSFKASRDSDCSSSSGSDPVPLLLGKSENSCDAAEGTAEINKR